MNALLVLGLLGAAAFVWITGGSLPAVVASHFGFNGIADDTMSKDAYLGLMVALVVIVPGLIGLTGRLAGVLPMGLVNLPNREVWLGPQRRAQTIATLSRRSAVFAIAIAIFICVVHWLVVQANMHPPARLDGTSMAVASAVFGAFTLAWVLALWRRFSRLP